MAGVVPMGASATKDFGVAPLPSITNLTLARGAEEIAAGAGGSVSNITIYKQATDLAVEAGQRQLREHHDLRARLGRGFDRRQHGRDVLRTGPEHRELRDAENGGRCVHESAVECRVETEVG